MLDSNIFPPYLILITVIFVIVPTIVAVLLRHSLYKYLIHSAHKVSRLLINESRGQQPTIVDKLEARFRQASQKLEQVNTIALIDGLYSQERLNFFGISLRCEQWDYFCQTLPNLLLAFGLLGTFIGISSNLYNLSETINVEQSQTDINDLITQLQTPLQGMGIAFLTSLIAIFCSSILISVNLRCNTNFAKSLLISSLEDYLDNIFKIEIKGYSRLDVAVDRMVQQQEEFLNRFHEKVGQVLETTIGNAANKMVSANQGFQNNVDSMVSRFNDISSSLSVSTNNFQESAFSLKEQMQTVTKIVPIFETAASKIESSSKLYLQSAEKIEASKFSENLESLTQDLATTQKSFSQSTAFLGNQIPKIIESHQQATELAQQVYTHLQTTSNKLQDGANSFTQAAATFKESDFAEQLVTATKELITIPQQFNNSTAILHQSTDTLGRAIDNINTSTQETSNLIQQVTNLNQHSTKLLEINANKTQQELDSFNKIQSELNNIVTTLEKHREQVNLSLANFGEKILHSFEQQTSNNITELKTLTTEINNSFNSLQKTQTETTKLIKILENYINIFNLIHTQLSQLLNTSEQQGKQTNSNLNGIIINSDRLLNSFEQHAQTNVQEIQNLIAEFKKASDQINIIPTEINQLTNAISQQSKQATSKANNSIEQSNKHINSYNQQLQNITKKIDKLL
jgi:uncharacterized protein YejL (UPF0352 family)